MLDFIDLVMMAALCGLALWYVIACEGLRENTFMILNMVASLCRRRCSCISSTRSCARRSSDVTQWLAANRSFIASCCSWRSLWAAI